MQRSHPLNRYVDKRLYAWGEWYLSGKPLIDDEIAEVHEMTEEVKEYHPTLHPFIIQYATGIVSDIHNGQAYIAPRLWISARLLPIFKYMKDNFNAK